MKECILLNELNKTDYEDEESIKICIKHCPVDHCSLEVGELSEEDTKLLLDKAKELMV